MTEAYQQLFDEKAEREILGSIMLEPHLLRQHDLMADEFYIGRFKYLYKLLKWMDSHNKTIDLLTVHQEMDNRNKLDYFGGIGELSELTQIVTTTHYKDQCAAVRDFSNRRRALKVVGELGQAITNTAKEFSVGQYINELMKTELGKSKTLHISDGLLSFDEWELERIDKNQSGELDKYPKTGLDSIDKALIFLEGGQTTRWTSRS